MSLAEVRICDILKNEYSDFLAYCAMAGKKTAGDLTPADYLAYQAQFGASGEIVAEIRTRIENFNPAAGKEEKLADQTDIVTEQGNLFASIFGVDPGTYTEILIEELQLGTRPYNGLTQMGCTTVADLLALSADELMKAKNIGRGSVEGIQRKLAEYLSGTIGENHHAMRLADFDGKEKTRLGELFNVDGQSSLDGQDISQLALSARAKNALTAIHCTTLSALLSLTVKDLWALPHIGKTTVENILTALSDFFSSPQGTQEAEKRNASEELVSRNLWVQVERMLAGAKYDRESLSSSEAQWFDACCVAREILGAELCLDAINGAAAIQGVMSALSAFQVQCSMHREIDRSIHALPPEIAEQQASFYWFAYCRSVWPKYTDEYISDNLVGEETYQFLCSLEEPLKNLDKCLPQSIENDPSSLQICADFVKWVASDLKSMVNEGIAACLNQTSPRCTEVLFQRTQGKTLEEIGAQKNITRERVRQMEAKAIRLFVSALHRGKCEAVLICSALSGGATILKKEHFQQCLDDRNAEALWYILCRGELDCAYYRFDVQIHAVVVGKFMAQTNLYETIAQLPDGMLWDEANTYIAQMSGGNVYLANRLKMEIGRKFRQYGNYLHRGRLTVVEICEYILKNRFPNGYKTGDADDERLFRQYMNELFGDVKGLPTGHAIDAKIGAVGFLCDRGKYIHPSAITIDPGTVDLINAYIADSPRTVLTFGEIYDALANRFAGTSITNKYIMQGALLRYGCPFTMKRDYVTKVPSANVAEELTAFIQKSGRIHKSKIEEEFAFDDTRLGQVLTRCPEVISLSAGYFMHSDLLVVTPDEMQGMREYLRRACADAPVSTRALLDDFKLQFPGFVLNNQIVYHGSLFGILQYLFKGEFHFSRPFISTEDVGNMTCRSVLLTHMNGINAIALGDLNDICSSAGVRFLSVQNMLAAIQPEYIRIDETTIMRSDLAGITEDVIYQVEELIQNDLVLDRYRPANKIEDFSWYPEVNVAWTPFLVESVMMLANSQITSIKIPMGVSTLPSVIFLGEEFADDDYASFVLKILKEEHQREPFRSASQVLRWLIEKGLCYRKMPYFLENGHHLYRDENGVFVVR